MSSSRGNSKSNVQRVRVPPQHPPMFEVALAHVAHETLGVVRPLRPLTSIARWAAGHTLAHLFVRRHLGPDTFGAALCGIVPNLTLPLSLLLWSCFTCIPTRRMCLPPIVIRCRRYVILQLLESKNITTCELGDMIRPHHPQNSFHSISHLDRERRNYVRNRPCKQGN